MARNYQHTQELLPQIKEMLAMRKPAKTLPEYKYENNRLRMENELLRDFLRSTERE